MWSIWMTLDSLDSCTYASSYSLSILIHITLCHGILWMAKQQHTMTTSFESLIRSFWIDRKSFISSKNKLQFSHLSSMPLSLSSSSRAHFVLFLSDFILCFDAYTCVYVYIQFTHIRRWISIKTNKTLALIFYFFD